MPYLLIITLLISAPSSYAEWAESAPVGSAFPQIDALDQHGKQWTNAELLGGHGLVLFFNRSTSW